MSNVRSEFKGKIIKEILEFDEICGLHLVFEDGSDLIVKPNGYETSKIVFSKTTQVLVEKEETISV